MSHLGEKQREKKKRERGAVVSVVGLVSYFVKIMGSSRGNGEVSVMRGSSLVIRLEIVVF